MRALAGFVRRQWLARPLAVSAACFLTGVLIAQRHEFALGAWLACAAALAALYGLILRKSGRRWFLLAMAAAVMLGGARMQLACQMNPQVPERFSIPFEGKVVSEPSLNADGDRIVCALRVDEMDGAPVRHTVRLYLRSDILPLEGIEYGQRLSCFGHIWPQDAATNPYEFDAREWLLSDGMTGMAAAKLEDVEVVSCDPGLGGWMIAARRAISDRIGELFPDNAELVRAFVLGDRTGMDSELTERFSQTGITHLICISGMHISVLAVAVSALLNRILPRRAAVAVTLAVILGYGFLIGFPASLIRATVMFASFSIAPVLGRPSDPVTRLATALLGMLAFNPLFILDGGFTLSFQASAGILLLAPPLERLFGVDRLRRIKPRASWTGNLALRAAKYFPQLLCSTLAAQLATLPTIIEFFGSQPLIAIPVNLLAIPLSMYAYPIALIALVLSVVWMPLAQLAAAGANLLFSMLVEVVNWFSALPPGAIHAPHYPGWLTAAHYALMIAASGMSRASIRIRRFLPVGLAGLIGVSILCARVQTAGFQVVFLDAGQADAAVVRTEGHVYLFDTGDLYSPVTDYVTASCLGVDAVFLSHPHYDHAGGLAELIEEMPPGAIYVPEGWFEADASDTVRAGIALAEEKGIPIVELSAGAEIRLSDHAVARICAPAGAANSVNDLSMVVEVAYRESGVLFTGDLSAEGEPSPLPDVDVLKVPHHGSAQACSDRMLAELTPQVSVIPVGENNYGHPSEQTLERLESAGSEVYRTDECGAVTVRILRDGTIRVRTYLPVEEP